MYIFHGMNEISDNASQNHQKPWTWAGLRPIRTRIRPAACGRVQNRTVQKTRRIRVLSLSLLCSWTLLLLPPTRARLTWKPVRWTLALKPTIWRSPRPCQSRNIAEPAASTAVIPTRLPGDVTQQLPDISRVSKREPSEKPEPTHVVFRNKGPKQHVELTRETKPKQQPA